MTGRPTIWIPKDTIKGLLTLQEEGKTLKEMSDYYQEHGIIINESTISRRLKKLNDEKE